MNWRVGFFRAWVLFAVLWVAASGAVSWYSWQNYRAAPAIEISPGTDPRIAEAIQSLERLSGRVERPDLGSYAAIGIGVPAGLLAAGAAIGWVVAGFRRPKL